MDYDNRMRFERSTLLKDGELGGTSGLRNLRLIFKRAWRSHSLSRFSVTVNTSPLELRRPFYKSFHDVRCANPIQFLTKRPDFFSAVEIFAELRGC